MKWILFILSVSSSASNRKFERTLEVTRMSQFDNSIVLESISRSVLGLVSVIRCHLQCADDISCQSFFYRLSDGFCQLHTRTFTTDSNWQNSKGTKHYQVTTSWCLVTNGYVYSRLTGMCYKLNTDKKTWPVARKSCQDEGGDLIVLDTQEKYDYIVDFIELLKLEGLRKVDILVGASDVLKEDDWVWVNGKVLSKENPIWAPNEPNNGVWSIGLLEGQDYAIISTLGGLKLDDDQLRALFFLCEITSNTI